MTKTIVIGGGVAGLASAALLAREGHQVLLLEKIDRLGGRIGVVRRQGFKFDTGPSWYLMPKVLDHFFELLGTSTAEQFDLRTLDPGYRVFSEPDSSGEAHSVAIPYGLKRVVDTFERIETGSSSAVREYVSSATQTMTMAERYFLYNPFTSLRSLATPEVVRALPKLIALLSTSLGRFAARRFSDPVLRQVLGYPAVFLGTDPRRAPALYHLMSALDLDEGVLYPMGGFARLVERFEALARDAGVELITNANVTEILTRRKANRFDVIGVKWQDSDGLQHIEDADIVVSGADLHHTETSLLPQEARSYPESWWRKRQSGPGAIIVLLGVKGNLPQLDHHSLFFTRDWDANFEAIFGKRATIPNPASIYVCKPSQTDGSVAPAGHENLFVLIPVPADISIGGGGPDGTGDDVVEETATLAIDQIARWANIPDLRERVVMRETIGPADFARDYNSWSGGMLGPSHILSQSAMFRAQNESKRVSGLYYAGATTSPGVGVPMCLISAELVLKRIRGDHSAGPIPTCPDASATSENR